MSEPRAWKDCPANRLANGPHVGDTAHDERCPTCTAHYEAVDEALAQVAALRELAQQVCTYRGGHMPDVPEPLRLRIADLYEAAFHLPAAEAFVRRVRAEGAEAVRKACAALADKRALSAHRHSANVAQSMDALAAAIRALPLPGEGT